MGVANVSGALGKSGGHNKKTTREHELLGNHHAGRIGTNEPGRGEAKPMQMGDMSEEALRIWHAVEPMLWNNGTIGDSDSMLLSMLCQRWAEWHKYYQRCITKGREIPIRDNDGKVIDFKEASWSKVEFKLWKQSVQLARDFGMSPVSRSSIEKIVRGEEVSKLLSIT